MYDDLIKREFSHRKSQQQNKTIETLLNSQAFITNLLHFSIFRSRSHVQMINLQLINIEYETEFFSKTAKTPL